MIFVDRGLDGAMQRSSMSNSAQLAIGMRTEHARRAETRHATSPDFGESEKPLAAASMISSHMQFEGSTDPAVMP